MPNADVAIADLAPFCSRRVIRRGKPCALLTHPSWLAALARARVTSALHGHEHHREPDRASSLQLEIRVESPEELLRGDEQRTERALLRAKTEELARNQAEMISAMAEIASKVGKLYEAQFPPEDDPIEDRSGDWGLGL
eukprot:SAG11_NODE_925_length_6524_cov_3.379300_1_plen_139_part_00